MIKELEENLKDSKNNHQTEHVFFVICLDVIIIIIINCFTAKVLNYKG